MGKTHAWVLSVDEEKALRISIWCDYTSRNGKVVGANDAGVWRLLIGV